MRLGELGEVLGGEIREVGYRRWLDTEVGGLRACIIDRETQFDLAVFTPAARELDPFVVKGPEWEMDGARIVPRLSAGFVFTRWRSGILFATSTDPSVASTVLALTELVGAASPRALDQVDLGDGRGGARPLVPIGNCRRARDATPVAETRATGTARLSAGTCHRIAAEHRVITSVLAGSLAALEVVPDDDHGPRRRRLDSRRPRPPALRQPRGRG